MAWPFTPLTTYVGGSLPAVKSYDLNQLQAYVNHWINGDRSVMHAVIDGTGNVDTSAVPDGQLRIGGAALESTARIKITGAPTNYLLKLEAPVDGTYFIREYAGSTGATFTGSVRTLNARWNVGDSKWYYDGAGVAGLFQDGTSGLNYYGYGGADGWLDAAWGVTTPGSADATMGVDVTTRGNVSALIGVVSGRYIKGLGSAPTVAADAANTGGGSAVIVAGGTNSSGVVTITTGGGVVASGKQATVTFAHGGFGAVPKVVLTPANDAAAGKVLYVPRTSATATVFDIFCTSALVAGGTAYEVVYQVIA